MSRAGGRRGDGEGPGEGAKPGARAEPAPHDQGLRVVPAAPGSRWAGRVALPPSPSWYGAHLGGWDSAGCRFAYAAGGGLVVLRPGDLRVAACLTPPRPPGGRRGAARPPGRYSAARFLSGPGLRSVLVASRSPEGELHFWDALSGTLLRRAALPGGDAPLADGEVAAKAAATGATRGGWDALEVHEARPGAVLCAGSAGLVALVGGAGAGAAEVLAALGSPVSCLAWRGGPDARGLCGGGRGDGGGVRGAGGGGGGGPPVLPPFSAASGPLRAWRRATWCWCERWPRRLRRRRRRRRRRRGGGGDPWTPSPSRAHTRGACRASSGARPSLVPPPGGGGSAGALGCSRAVETGSSRSGPRSSGRALLADPPSRRPPCSPWRPSGSRDPPALRGGRIPARGRGCPRHGPAGLASPTGERRAGPRAGATQSRGRTPLASLACSRAWRAGISCGGAAPWARGAWDRAGLRPLCALTAATRGPFSCWPCAR